MLNFRVNGNSMVRQVNLIGIDETTHSQVSDFGCYLQHPENRKKLSFELRDGGYDVRDHQGGAETKERMQMRSGGWQHRRWWAQREKAFQMPVQETQPEASKPNAAANPFAKKSDPDTQENAETQKEFDPETDQNTGIVMGMALGSYRNKAGVDIFMVLPGDDVKVTIPTAGMPPKITSDEFTIVDFYESKMSEYDSSFVFVPIKKLQELRGMIEPSTGIANVTSIQIKLKEGVDGSVVRDKLRAVFPPQVYGISTWQDKQGPLLQAVSMETAILNLLLVMIIAVAGFGILAIFFMIVVEKTKDIGILKSLGAPARGIMGIFLTYGLSLGLVGAGAGVISGILFVVYINKIADCLSYLTGAPVFSPDIYYFQKIPTIIEPFTVAWVAAGAILIAIAASALPARRAARMHPVEALRYE
jgi:lipoprotein-releasing system permease protein